METHCEFIGYESTGYFSKLMIDYLNEDERLKPFYKHPVSIEGIKAAVDARKQAETPRKLLVQELRKQYEGLALSQLQEENLQLLLQSNTFTVCTAHQPNIFTGPLFFIYKILHAVKLANHLNEQLPETKFVPVYYMGSEDADLDELGHIYISGDKFTWDTKQTGAVGRMKVDKQLILLIERMAGQLEVHEFGKELVQLLKRSYKEGVLIQHATLQLVNELFKDFGLLVLVQDNTALKRVFSSIVKKELTEQFSHPIVEETITSLSEHYKPQAGGRELNMFYLTESKRERIEKQGAGYKVESLGLFWSEKEILNEVDEHPERFSPNVILRGVFQETILPNIAFIGGGGEIAYWLELQEVFEACNVPFPVLIIRNSFLLYEEAQKQLIEKLGFKVKDLFHSTEELVTTLVKRESQLQLNLTAEKEQLQVLYQQLKDVAHAIDPTLAEHTEALKVKALDKVGGLEKKMLRAEKRKFEAQKRQITKLREQLFPQEELQERVDNFSTFFAKYGKKWLDEIYRSSLGLEQELAILQLAKTETLTQRA